MSKKKWLLLILCILLVAGYWKFFYKTYSETAVAKSADCIFALDVKRVTNTLIWNFITTPSQWKKISTSSGKKISWKDMVKIPDYVFVFHSAGHPGNAWYSLLEIKDEDDFQEGLLLYHFSKREVPQGQPEYFSTESGIDIIRSGNKILVGNNTVADKRLIRQVAAEMFVQKSFIARNQLFKNVGASSHLSIQVMKNGLLEEDGIVKLNFDKTKISIDALLQPGKQFKLKQGTFIYSQEALCAAGFAQLPAALYELIPPATKQKISKAVNFDIDSVLLPYNHFYTLNITSIAPRVDSAITYEYDDDFNKVEKVVVNNVMEPSFDFTIHSDSISNIYHYWNNNGQLEKTVQGDLFTPMPFVKSYCNIKSGEELAVTSPGYQLQPRVNAIYCVCFLKIMLTKIPGELLKYFPESLNKSIANLESIELTVKKNEGELRVLGRVNKKDNDLPIIKL